MSRLQPLRERAEENPIETEEIRHGRSRRARRRARPLVRYGAGRATHPEVMGVLQICGAQGVQACNMGLPILAEELARAGEEPGASA